MSKELFMKKLLKPVAGCEILNSIGFVQLPNNRLAKLTLSTSSTHDLIPTSGTYKSVRVSIIEKNSGEIDAELFCFDDYLEIDKTKRTDARGFKVIDHCGWNWYILIPTNKSLKKYTEAINAYIQMFQ